MVLDRPLAITQHLTQLLRNYVPVAPQHGKLWILDPFSMGPASHTLAMLHSGYWLPVSMSLCQNRQLHFCCLSYHLFESQGILLWILQSQRQGTKWKQFWMVWHPLIHPPRHNLIVSQKRALVLINLFSLFWTLFLCQQDCHSYYYLFSDPITCLWAMSLLLGYFIKRSLISLHETSLFFFFFQKSPAALAFVPKNAEAQYTYIIAHGMMNNKMI